MSAVAASAVVRPRRPSMAAALVAGASIATLGSLGYVSMNGLPPREAFLHPVGLISAAATTIGCLMLSLAMARWRSTLPRWAVLTSAAGLWFAGATTWSQATVVVATATKTGNELFDDLYFASPWVIGGMAPKSILCLVGFLGLAIAGWRSRSIPRSAAVAFALAALLSVWPPHPPGLIVASLALILVARSDPRANGA